jgi:hypothetical protein
VSRRGWRWFTIAAFVTVAFVAVVEVALRLMGLGAPILYENRLAFGYRPRPNQTRERLRGATVHVNNLGVRGPDVPAMPSPGTLRLLFLGDSVTWGGSYVDDRELFASVAADTVRAQLPGRFSVVEALAAGVNGWGPENVLGLVRDSGGFASQIWVWTLLEDDLVREKTHFGEVPYFGSAPWSAWEELLVLAAYKLMTAYKVRKPDADLAALAAQNVATFRDVAAQARAGGAHLLTVWHPTVEAVAGTAEPHARVLAAAAVGDGLPFLDLSDAYRRTGDAPSLYVDGMHLSVRGHEVAGRAIGERVVGLVVAAR